MKEFKGTVNGVEYTEIEDYKDAVRTLASNGELESARFNWIEKEDKFMKTLNGIEYTSKEAYEKAVQNLLNDIDNTPAESESETEVIDLLAILFPLFEANENTGELVYSKSAPCIDSDPESVDIAIDNFIDITGNNLIPYLDVFSQKDIRDEAIAMLNDQCEIIDRNLKGMSANVYDMIQKLNPSSDPLEVSAVRTLYNIVIFTTTVSAFYRFIGNELTSDSPMTPDKVNQIRNIMRGLYNGRIFNEVHNIISKKVTKKPAGAPRSTVVPENGIYQDLAGLSIDDIRKITATAINALRQRESKVYGRETHPQKERTFAQKYRSRKFEDMDPQELLRRIFDI